MVSQFQAKYGVIQCCNCNLGKGVDLRYQTTKCPRCGKLLHIKKQEILYFTNNEKDLQVAIAEINKRAMMS